MQVTKHANKGSNLALKPRANVTRSLKQGYQWPPQKLFRMRTAHLLPVSPSMHYAGGVSASGPGGVYPRMHWDRHTHPREQNDRQM